MTTYNSPERLTECEQYKINNPNDVGRLFELCMGQSFSDRPIDPLASANWRRAHILSKNSSTQQSPVFAKKNFLVAGTSEASYELLAKLKQKAAMSPVNVGLGRPGYHLHQVFKEVGQEYKPGCSCENVANKMDAWGIEGCELHKPEIIELLHASAEKLSLWEKAKLAAKAISQGYLLNISAEGFLEEALRRAKEEVKSVTP